MKKRHKEKALGIRDRDSESLSICGGAGIKLILAYYLNRHLYLSFIDKKIINIKLFGKSFYLRLYSSDIIFAYSILIGERKEKKLVGEYDFNIGSEIDCILDCGANIGLFSVLYANRYPNKIIIAVEPEPNNYKILKKNTCMYKNINVIHAGVWYKDTSLSLEPSRVKYENRDSYSDGAFFLDEQIENNSKIVKGIDINTLVNYSIEKYNTTYFFVKMDIEGAESEIFEKNSLNWIDYCNILVIEIHDWIIPNKGLKEYITSKMYYKGFRKMVLGENTIFKKIYYSNEERAIDNEDICSYTNKK